MLPDEPSHPLDPLTPQELQQAIEIVRKEKALTRDHLFVFTLLAEPSKAALKAWGGKHENLAAGQRAFMHRAKMNGLASLAKYDAALESAA